MSAASREWEETYQYCGQWERSDAVSDGVCVCVCVCLYTHVYVGERERDSE